MKTLKRIRRFPVTTFTFVGFILSAWAIGIQADYAGGWESLLFWSAWLFGVIPWFIQECSYTFREWFGWSVIDWWISFPLGVAASFLIDTLIRAILVRLRLISKPNAPHGTNPVEQPVEPECGLNL